MAFLILDNITPTASKRGLVLDGRITIGRRPFNTVMIPDPAVSRIHAWIGRRNGDESFTLYDAGSRSGTLLNGKPAREPRALHHGDEIQIGQATITFLETGEFPADVTRFNPPPAPPAADPYDGGIYFDCPCGGPMWVTDDLAGATGRCRYCGQRLIVPHLSGTVARPMLPKGIAETQGLPTPHIAKARVPVEPIRVEDVPTEVGTPVHFPAPTLHLPTPKRELTPEPTCSICQTPILPEEEHTSCPSCHLTFHAQCWQENFGCSAYGCNQVNILASPEEEVAPAASHQAADHVDSQSYPPAEVAEAIIAPSGRHFPWETLLLALSFVAMGLGALAFGGPSALMLLWSSVFLISKRPARKGLVVVAIVVSLLGTIAGLVTSLFWWKGIRIWETFIK